MKDSPAVFDGRLAFSGPVVEVSGPGWIDAPFTFTGGFAAYAEPATLLLLGGGLAALVRRRLAGTGRQ